MVKSGQATISGNVLTITGPGKVVVEASQAGNATYAAAPVLDQSFTVTPAPVVISKPTRMAIVGEQALFSRKLKKGKPTGKAVLTGFKLNFGVPLNSAAASSYQVDAITIKKVKKQKVAILQPIT
jgi:hypothetical protein